MPFDQIALAAGMAGVFRWLVDREERPSPALAMTLAGTAVGLMVLWLATSEGVVGALLTAPFLVIGAVTLGWVMLANTDRWTSRTLAPLAVAGLALMLLALFV